MLTKRANQAAKNKERVMVVYGAKMQVMRCAECKLNLTLVVTEKRCQLAWCMACAHNLKVVTTGLTTDVLRINSYTIRQWVDSGATQFISTTEGMLLIVLISPRASGRLRPNIRISPQSSARPQSESMTLPRLPHLDSVVPQPAHITT